MTKQKSNFKYCTYQASHSAEIVAVALLIIGLVSFVGVIVKSLNF